MPRPLKLFADTGTLHERISIDEANSVLSTEHYLGPIQRNALCFGTFVDGELVAVQVWNKPTARMLPSDGSWLELSRWCLTADTPANGGSMQMGYVRKWLRANYKPRPVTLVSYSDPVHGHTGTLYKASGWSSSPTHHQERFEATDGRGYPSGHGSWDGSTIQTPKAQWVTTV